MNNRIFNINICDKSGSIELERTLTDEEIEELRGGLILELKLDVTKIILKETIPAPAGSIILTSEVSVNVVGCVQKLAKIGGATTSISTIKKIAGEKLEVGDAVTTGNDEKVYKLHAGKINDSKSKV